MKLYGLKCLYFCLTVFIFFVLVLVATMSPFSVMRSPSWLATLPGFLSSATRSASTSATTSASSQKMEGNLGTPACHVPDFQPFDESVKPALKGADPFCDPPPMLTYREGKRVFVNSSLLSKDQNFSHCEVAAITVNKDRSHLSQTGKAKRFHEAVEVWDEFVKVTCFNTTSSQPFFTNFHAFVHDKPGLATRWSSQSGVGRTSAQPRAAPRQQRRPLSVALIGLDSTSRLNAVRFLNESRRLLSHNRSFVELDLHNKVGENTFPNMFPFLTGRSVDEFPSFFNKTKDKGPFDEIPFIWKDYGNQGHVTFYAEDRAGGAIFEYIRRGFRRPPTDYYDIFANLLMKEWAVPQKCSYLPLETAWVLDYLGQFIEKFAHQPTFALTFLSGLTHDADLGGIMVDKLLSPMLQASLLSGALDNTLLLVFGDHGRRWGPVRRTRIGAFEDRLPFMSLSFPAWFENRYPAPVAKLRENARQLTSHFDIYETLRDVLAFGQGLHRSQETLQAGAPSATSDDFQALVSAGFSLLQERDPDTAWRKSPHGISLFRDIPASRTCSAAGIPDNWCACLGQGDQVRNATAIAQAFVDNINSILNKTAKGLCAPLRVHELRSAERIAFLDETNSTQTFRIVVETEPGRGLFEAMVQLSTGSRRMSRLTQNEVSRLNVYGNQSICVNDSFLKLLCFCVKSS